MEDRSGGGPLLLNSPFSSILKKVWQFLVLVKDLSAWIRSAVIQLCLMDGAIAELWKSWGVPMSGGSTDGGMGLPRCFLHSPPSPCFAPSRLHLFCFGF